MPSAGQALPRDGGAHEIRIHYWLTGDVDERAITRALDQLSADERARQERFVFPNDRRDFAAAHLLLRESLSARRPRPPREWRFVAGPHGKPALAPDAGDAPPLSFNLSHTAGLVACVVAEDLDVGIDVESVSRTFDTLELARRYFSETEVETLERCEGAERQSRFAEIWTLKEAYLKGTGEGILGGIKDHAFAFGEPETVEFRSTSRLPASGWNFALFGLSHYRLAIAVHTPLQHCGCVVRLSNHAGGGAGTNEEVRLLRFSPRLSVDRAEP